ncbi:ROK family transcriptional regulator [Salinisphaera sp. Q1T1-3]|uniref:ROK family transcriptional regulator n=1 Tax=Salinisphaera sp. Q1T1-3 TaxID=2321229 RepID=UPI001314FD5C|nr:ROK family transcriptional regulator [Salinisphaera sp. Q1T1-3]
MEISEITGRKSDKEEKKRFIVNCLRKSGQLSRREIATRSGLSPATVSALVTELLDEALVVEEDAVKSPGGRRPTPIRINYEDGLAIGIKLNFSRIEGVLTDMSTGIADRCECQLIDREVETVLDAVEWVVRALMRTSAAAARPVHGIGVAIPGAIDTINGICRVSHRLGWRDVAFAERLRARLDVPVHIDDDSHAFALAQSLFGLGLTRRSFATLAIGDGISVGMVLAGKVHRGETGAAGKLGHVRHAVDGRRCECGRVGCLQAMHAVGGMLAQWRGTADRRTFASDFAGLVSAAQAGHASALAIARSAGEAIGQHLATFVNVADLRAIVLGGEAVALGDALIEPLGDQLGALVFGAPVVLTIDEHSDFWSRGAAALVTQIQFDF